MEHFKIAGTIRPVTKTIAYATAQYIMLPNL